LRKAGRNNPDYMTKAKTFAIVGGGIGGLTAAIALQKKGFDVKVYENAPVFKPVGAGIVLAANAMKAFQAIGIDQEVLSAGKELKRFAIKNTQGDYLSTTEAEEINLKYGVVNTLTLHRADLHQVLVNQLNPTVIHKAKNCVDFVVKSDGVELQFADGSSSQEDFVIGADGIHSVFRNKLLPLSSLRYSGYTCWRAAISDVPEDLVSDEAVETWGRGKRFGMVPLTNNRIYWYATVNAPQSNKSFSCSIDEVAQSFKEFHYPVGKILSMTKSEQLIRNDISDFKPITRYAFGNIVLMGDAAHATTPNLGQGACMAIEDAVILANCIDKESDAVKAFGYFQHLRIKRNTQIVNASYSLGKIAQFKNPLLASVRNAAMRFTPASVADKQLKFLYDISFS
jgi:2-polyprenyl-6-methoxyphenol hydroxylase-like FAD-dependent oxidoreductase